jgi:hypothetical protein
MTARRKKIWMNLLNVESPVGIKATLRTAAQLADSIGLFHRAMLKSVNGYVYKHCPKHHPLTEPASKAPAKPARPKTANTAIQRSSDPAIRRSGAACYGKEVAVLPFRMLRSSDIGVEINYRHTQALARCGLQIYPIQP